MVSVNDMMSGIKLTKNTATMFSSNSLFVDPSASGRASLSIIKDNLSSLAGTPGINASIGNLANQMTSTFTSYDAAISSNMERVATISETLPKVMASSNVQNAISIVDGGGGTGCDVVDQAFGSIKNIGNIISTNISSMQSAISGVLSDLGDIFNAGYTAVASVINAASSAIISALNTMKAAIESALTEFQNMVAAELAVIENMLSDLFDFSFLKSIANIGQCGKVLMDNLVNPEKVDYDKLKMI